VTSVVRSDHKAVIVYANRSHPQPKTAVQRTYRRQMPAQHARFLQHIASTDLTNPHPSASSDPPPPPPINSQTEFDHFYMIARNFMDQFHPEQTITLTSRDPPYVTPAIKSMLRSKNKLMRAGRVEEANALSVRIGQAIQCRCGSQLSRRSSRADASSIWAAVRRLTGRHAAPVRVEGVTAELLNRHCADISTDPQYTEPARKQSAAGATCPPRRVSEWKMFRMLDTLRPTTVGLDELPAWYLKLTTRIFCNHLAYLFNLSIASCSVPSQWKEACITPIPKVSCPQQPSDFRPISITPILSRLMERAVVRSFLYPAFLKPAHNLSFSDQYAFRPNGSTKAASLSPTNCHQPATVQSLCRRHFIGLLKSVQHRPPMPHY
jgi:hypothetical protein